MTDALLMLFVVGAIVLALAVDCAAIKPIDHQPEGHHPSSENARLDSNAVAKILMKTTDDLRSLRPAPPPLKPTRLLPGAPFSKQP